MDRNGNGKKPDKVWGIQDLESRQEHVLMARVPLENASRAQMRRFHREFLELFPELQKIIDRNRMQQLARVIHARRTRARRGTLPLILAGNLYR